MSIAGTGSGWLAVSLARICKQVTSYDNREEFIKIAEKNKLNEKLRQPYNKEKGRTRRGLPGKNLADLVTLDMPN